MLPSTPRHISIRVYPILAHLFSRIIDFGFPSRPQLEKPTLLDPAPKMPRYISLSSLPQAFNHCIRPLQPPPDPNPLVRYPNPSQHLLALPPGSLPPNLRVQEWVDDKRHWEGVGQVDRLGGRKTKDDGKTWRVGKGREARKLGGLKWALRER